MIEPRRPGYSRKLTNQTPVVLQRKEYNMSNEDLKHLDLLALFHYIVGGITAFFSCVPFLHVFMGLGIVSGKLFEESNGPVPPPFFGWIFVIMGSIFIILGWCLAVSIIIAGRKLKRRKNRIFCIVIAGIECMFTPFGTILGVFTLIALNKDSIKAIFAEHVAPPLPSEGTPSEGRVA